MEETLFLPPKGKLMAVGGAEDKGGDADEVVLKHTVDFFEFGILKRFLTEMKGTNSRVEVITTASLIPEEVGAVYVRAFHKLGARNVGVLNIRKRGESDWPAYLERLSKADGILFSGGDQVRLLKIFGGTQFLNLLRQRYQAENFVIMGTSAGAMAMAEIMICRGSSADALLKGEVKLADGLRLMEKVIIDTHFVKRGRFGRLVEAVASYPGCIGIGLADDTGVLVTQGRYLETIGSGMVIIVDGHNISHVNVRDIREGQPVSVADLRVHVLAMGNHYDLHNRTFSAKDLRLPQTVLTLK